MRIVRGFYNEQNNTVNVIHYDINCIISLDCGKWKSGLRTTPNSQGRMDALAIDDPVEYVKLMLGGKCRCGWMRWMIVPYGESKSGVIFQKGRRK